MQPGATGAGLLVEQQEGQRRAAQEVGGGQGGLAAADDEYVHCSRGVQHAGPRMSVMVAGHWGRSGFTGMAKP
ncbi:hypothetical protein D9M71_774170 [compost metagenome]